VSVVPSLLTWRVGGLLASAAIVGAIILVVRLTADVGYVEIKTVPVAPVTQAALYLDSTKLDPIRQGDALLRQPVGTLKLQVAGFGTPLCSIVVKRNRITTVTISVLERPPRCQCRFTASGDANDRTCVS
jgi:hypothetical protein